MKVVLVVCFLAMPFFGLMGSMAAGEYIVDAVIRWGLAFGYSCLMLLAMVIGYRLSRYRDR